jgi:hypothetical protein
MRMGMMRTIAVVAASIFTAASSLSVAARAQQALSADAAGDGQVLTLSPVVKFEGAEKRNCPTGAVMLMLLGSRATLTIPQVPPVAKEVAVQTDIDADFFDNTIFRTAVLPDHSGRQFEFMKPTCTVEITIRYR